MLYCRRISCGKYRISGSTKVFQRRSFTDSYDLILFFDRVFDLFSPFGIFNTLRGGRAVDGSRSDV